MKDKKQGSVMLLRSNGGHRLHIVDSDKQPRNSRTLVAICGYKPTGGSRGRWATRASQSIQEAIDAETVCDACVAKYAKDYDYAYTPRDDSNDALTYGWLIGKAKADYRYKVDPMEMDSTIVGWAKVPMSNEPLWLKPAAEGISEGFDVFIGKDRLLRKPLKTRDDVRKLIDEFKLA